ncbi:MAG: hypothetical protein JJ896_09920 [Rhodothermales bacterium]|nr:hypothetical protein [Rhodothermales bacterium]MBO6779957.1 hypothetical protein [Rhodothermales bacterium]
MAKKIYSEKEVAALVGAAARLQARAEESHTAGLTLEEVREAARAAGIDPQWVDHAAASAMRAQAPSTWLGVPVSVHRTRLFKGEVSDEAWGRMVSEMRRSLGGLGQAESFGSSRMWHRRPLQISVDETEDGTLFRADADWSYEVRSLAGLPGMLAFFATLAGFVGMVDGAWRLLILGALLTAATLVTALAFYGRYRAKERRVGEKFDHMLDRMEAIAEAEGARRERAFGDEDVVATGEGPSLEITDEPASESERASRRSRIR